VASVRPIASTPVDHRVLGPAVAIYADRRQSLASIFLYMAFLCIAALGLFIGLGDLGTKGSSAATFGIPGPILGTAQIAAAVVVAAWCARATFFAVGRIRQPAALIVGRAGFEYVDGHGPVGWDEVETVGAPAYRNSARLTVQLIDPAEYSARHHLSPIGRLLLRLDHYDLTIGYLMIMPTAELQDLMQRRLAEFRHRGAGGGLVPEPKAPKRRRPARKSPARPN
jgi:hypothetical protein